MGTIIKLAWRNIWRNRRRTLITIASIFFAIFFSLMMRSIQIGTFSHLVDNAVHSYTGYIQVHKKGYWDDKDINNSFDLTDTILKSLKSNINVSEVIPRLESFALASSGPKTKGVMVIGIDPEKEDRMTGLTGKIVEGRFLNESDSGIIVASKLADYLGLHAGDTLVLIGQGYHGTSAAGKWPVAGIVHFPSPELDRQMVYLPLKLAQDFYEAGNNVTSLVLDLKDSGKSDKTLEELENTPISINYEIMSWKMMLVELVQLVESKTASSLIMLGILYMIVGFGIYGTIVMMTLERIKEMGIMMTVGMQKNRVRLMMLCESFMIGITGVLAGIVTTLPIILWFSHHPLKLAGEMAKTYESYGFESLLCFEPPSYYFLKSALVIGILVLISTIYPLRKIGRLKLIDALHYKG
jgi:ABC-type lipoprotein release transport system permease subunit